jgi:predicted peptidase
MKQRRSIQWVLFLSFVLLAVFGGGCGGGSSSHSSSSDGGGNTATVEGKIERVTTLAFVDVDGPKVQAIVVEYDVELPSGSVNEDTYEVFHFGNLPSVAVRDGDTEHATTTVPVYANVVAAHGIPGEVTKVYVSKTPAIGGGDDSGKYVIIEINAASQVAGYLANWRAKLAGGVKQVNAINAGNISVPSSGEEPIGNYESGEIVNTSPQGVVTITSKAAVFDDTSYVLTGLEGYEIHTVNYADTIARNNRSGIEIVEDPYRATHCWSETYGDYYNVDDLMYSLFVPKDYAEQVAAGKKFALALHIEDAGMTGPDPMIALNEVSVAANYASARVQKIVKDQGLGGLIVVLPQITKAGFGNTVRDNLTGNQYIPAVWQLMDYLVGNTALGITGKYAIDTDRIYGSGQSMGGMQVLYMASHRDNYFAGIWSIGSNWGNNYNKERPFQQQGQPSAVPYFVFPDSEPFITNVNWKNWLYSVSDDNILVTNMTADPRATGYWGELKDIYQALANTTVPKIEWDPIVTSRDEQNFKLQVLTSLPNATGIYWNALSNGGHMDTWTYAHAITYSYDWLLRQTQTSIGNRGKLEKLNQPDPLGTINYNSYLW